MAETDRLAVVLAVVDGVAKRRTGRYTTTSVAGEQARASVPHPLPPAPPVRLEGALGERLVAATLALGRLDGNCALLPDMALFLYTCVRQGSGAVFGH